MASIAMAYAGVAEILLVMAYMVMASIGSVGTRSVGTAAGMEPCEEATKVSARITETSVGRQRSGPKVVLATFDENGETTDASASDSATPTCAARSAPQSLPI